MYVCDVMSECVSLALSLSTGRLCVELQGGIEADREREGRGLRGRHPAHRGRRHHRGGTAADGAGRRPARALYTHGLCHGMLSCEP